MRGVSLRAGGEGRSVRRQRCRGGCGSTRWLLGGSGFCAGVLRLRNAFLRWQQHAGSAGERHEPWYPETHRERAACRLLQSSARLITRSPFAADLQEQINQSARLDEILLLLCPFLATSFIIFIIHLQGTGINYANEFADFADYFICRYCLWKFNY